MPISNHKIDSFFRPCLFSTTMDELQYLSNDAKTILQNNIQKRLNREYSAGFFHGILTGAIIAALSITVGLQLR
jgi:hypothetical protein